MKEQHACCRGSSLWLQWLKTRGGGGPTYPPEPTGLISGSFWDNSGKLKRTEVLNRFTQHTSKCAACSKVMESISRPSRAFPPVHITLRSIGFRAYTTKLDLGKGPLLVTLHSTD